MTKQDFLAISLPYGLKVYVKYNHKPEHSELEKMIGIVDDRIITDMLDEDIAPLSISEYGLCLRPLSDLTKEIEHNGERFVPSKEIHKYCPNELIDVSYIFSMKYIDIKSLPFWAVIKLIEWKFDLFNGIKNKEAIDVNNLETNPYK